MAIAAERYARLLEGIVGPDIAREAIGSAERDRQDVPLPHAFRVHDVLEVRWGRAADEPLTTLWILGFYGVAWFRALTMPRARPWPGKEHRAVPMLWPGPAAA